MRSRSPITASEIPSAEERGNRTSAHLEDSATATMNGMQERTSILEESNRVIWLGKKIPQDRMIVKNELRKLNLWLYWSMVAFSLAGVTIAGILIYFNFKYAHRRIIQHSDPSCNNLMLVGIIYCLLAIIPLGLDGRFVPPPMFPVACGLGIWLLTIGFTLAYGAMFSKIWRVRRLTTKGKSAEVHSNNKMKKTKNASSWRLWAAVGSLLVVDLILLSIWAIVDPLRRHVHNFPVESSANPEEDDIVIQPQHEHCESNHHHLWMGVTFAYKGLQLILGLFLAYETRSVEAKQINDSRLVGMSIYNVSVLCMITAPVMLVIGNQGDASFAFISLANIFCCFLSMALIFIPKIVFVWKHAHDPKEKDDDEGDKDTQELNYRELLQENEQLKSRISNMEQKLSVLRGRIADKKEEAIQEATLLGKQMGIVDSLLFNASDCSMVGSSSLANSSATCQQIHSNGDFAKTKDKYCCSKLGSPCKGNDAASSDSSIVTFGTSATSGEDSISYHRTLSLDELVESYL